MKWLNSSEDASARRGSVRSEAGQTVAKRAAKRRSPAVGERGGRSAQAALRHESRSQRRHNLTLENLEDRILMASGYPVDPIYAPGTPQEYVDQHPDAFDGCPPDSQISCFQLAARWTRTATDPGPLVQGQPTTITWSIAPDGTSIPGFFGEAASNSNLIAFLDGLYGTAPGPLPNRPWFPLFAEALDRWDRESGVRYVFEPSDDGAAFDSPETSPGVLGVRGDKRIGGHLIDGTAGILAYNFFPNNGNMVIDTGDATYNDKSNNSRILLNVLGHETGHGLGFRHVDPTDQTKLMEAFLSTNFDGPQHDDLLAVHRHYGDRFEDNDIAGTATSLGSLFGGTITVDRVSIDDDSDGDYYGFTVTAGNEASVTVRPVGFTYLQGPQGGPTSLFDSKSQSDLAVDLIDRDGVTVLATANATGLGLSETIPNTQLGAAGTYFIRVTGAQDMVQLYDFDLSVAQTELVVLNTTPIGPANAPVNAINVTFSVDVDTTTFTPADVTIVNPKGGVVLASGLVPVSARQFQVTFSAQTSPGTYTYTIGPNIFSVGGAQMNQNGVSPRGESGAAPMGDQYQASFSLPVDDTNVFPHPAAANNPSIVVNPFDSDFLVAAYEDWSTPNADGTSFSNSAPFIGATPRIGVSYSTNRGLDWQHVNLPFPSGLAGLDTASSPTLAYDSSGRLALLVGASEGRQINAASPADRFAQNNGIFVYTSSDNGVTWSGPVQVNSTGIVCGATRCFDDQATVASDIRPTSRIGATAFANNLYAVWTRFYPDGQFPGNPSSVGGGDIFLAQSSNFGATWSAPMRLTSAAQQPSNVPTNFTGTAAVQGADLSIGPNGDLYVAYQVGTRTAMQRLTHDAAGNLVLAGLPTNPFGNGTVSSVGAALPNEAFRANAFPGIEVAPDPLVPGRTNLYVVAANDPDGVGVGTDGGDIRFVRSIDNGLTWSSPIKVNSDALGKNQIFPALATDDRGNISIIWYDARGDANNRNLKVFARSSNDGGVSFGAELNPPVGARAFDPNKGLPTAEIPGRLGDHLGLAARRGEAFAIWTATNPLQPLPQDQQDLFFESFLVGPAPAVAGPIVTATAPRDIFFSTEDFNGNGILDAGEDTNPNGQIDVNAPPISGVSPTITEISVEFSQGLDEIFAEDERNFDLRRTGPDGVFDTPDDVQYHVTPIYTPAAIDLADPAKIGRSRVRLQIDFAANPLTAAESRLPAANFRLLVNGDDPIIGRNDVRLANGRDKLMYFKVVDVPSFPTLTCEVGAACPSPFTPRVAEPNGTLASALPIRLREGAEHTARGRINLTTDVDIYRVDLHVGDVLIVDVDAQETLGSTLNSVVRIFDTAGSQVAGNDDGTDPDTGVASPDSALTFVVPLTGSYFIAVSSSGAVYDAITGVVSTPGAAVGGNPTYDLQLRVAPPYDSATANNDVIATATSVRLRPGVEDVLRANLGDNAALASPADDVDLYAISLEANDRLDVSVDALFTMLATPADTVLRIFDSTGTQLLINSAAGDPNLVFNVAVTGIYYVGVSAKPNTMYSALAGGTTTSGSAASLGQYDLRLERRPLFNQVPSPVYARADFVGASTGVYSTPFTTIQQAINTASGTPGRQIVILGNANDAPFVVNPADANVNRRTFNLNSVNTLTIESGTIIKFFNATADIQGVGTLLSRGAFSDPVSLTSLRDDARGGDTNGDAGTTIPLKEDWGGIRLLSTSNSLVSLIDSTELRYGGGLVTALGRRFSPIHVDSDVDLIANAAVVNTTRPTITNNLIVDSGEPAISAHLLDMVGAGPGGQQGPLIAGNQIDRSSINGLFIRVGTDPGTGQFRQLNGTMHLDDTTIAHVLTDNLDVVGGQVILDPGIVLKMRNNQMRMRSGSGARFTSTGGTVTAVQDDAAGAGANAVGERQFDTNNSRTSATTDPLVPQAGNWGGLIFEPGSIGCIIDSAENITNAATSNQTSCPAGLTPFGAALPAIPSVVAYGGGTVPNFAGGFTALNTITITGTPTSAPPRPTFVNIRNSIIHDNRGDAINVSDGEVNFTGNRITGTVAGGAGNGSAFNVDANTLDTVLFNIPRDPMIKGNRLENNAFNGLFIRGSTLGRDGVWNDPDITHIVGGTFDVGGAAGSVLLTIRDGVVVKGCTTTTAGCGAAGAILVNGSGTGQNGAASSGLRLLGTPFSEDTNGNYRLDAAEDQATFGVPNASLDRGPVVLTSLRDDTVVVRGYTVGPDGMPGLAGVDDDGVNGTDDPGELGVGDDASFSQFDANNNGQSVGSPGDWQGITLTAFSNDGWKAIGSTIVPDNTVGVAPNVVSVQFALNSNGRTVLQDTGGFRNLAGGAPTTVASLVISTDPALTNDDLQFTAVAFGAAGNNIRVRYVVAGLNTTLSQTAAGTDITFNLATDGAGNSITTGADLINLLARGNKVDHADIRFAVDGVTVVGQPMHSPFFADFVDPEGPNGTGPAQPRSPTVGATNGGLPAIGNLGSWCDNNMNASFQTAVRLGACNGSPTNFNPSLSVTGWISDPQDVDFYSFTADAGSQIWVDIDVAQRPGTAPLDTMVALYRISLDANGNRGLDMFAFGDDDDQRTGPDPFNLSNGAMAFDTVIGPLTMPGSQPRIFDNRGGSDNLYFIAVTGFANQPDELCNPGTPPGPSPDMLTPLRDSGFSTTLDFGQSVSDQPGYDIPPGTAGFCGLGGGGNTGQYQLELRVVSSLNTDPGSVLPDVTRPQGKVNISNSTFNNNSNSGLRQIPGDPITQPDSTNAMPVPGPMRNLPGGGTGNALYPGINVFNNAFMNNGNFGVTIAGQSVAAVTGLPVVPQQFALVVNNTFSQNGTAIDIRDRSAPTLLNNIVSFGTTGIAVDGTSAGTTVIGHNLFFGNTNNGSTGNNPTLGQDPRFVSAGSDLRLTIGSTAIDQSLSNLADRMQGARLSLDPFDTANPVRDPSNLERSVPEPTFGTERNVASAQITDHDSLDRVDDPNTPNIGVGTDPFIDIGAYDLRDVKLPIIRSFALARRDDTGEVNEAGPFLTRVSSTTFRGFVTDDSNDIDGLLVQIDVDGNLDFLDGSAFTRLLRDAAGNPISFNNTGLLVAEFLVTSALPIADIASQSIRARVFDRSGNVSLPQNVIIGVDTVAPSATNATTNTNTSPTLVTVTYSEPVLIQDNFLRGYWQFESEPGSRAFPGGVVLDNSLSLNHGTTSGDVFGVSSVVTVEASLITDGVAPDSLIFHAVERGPTGATIRVQFVAGASTSVAVTDSDVTVSFAAGATAAQIATFLQTDPSAGAVAARRLVSTALAPGSSGAGAVAAFGPTRLAQQPVHAVGSRSVADFRGPFDNSSLATPPRPLITVPDNPDGSLDLTGEFTLSAWVNPRDFGASPNLVDAKRRPLISKHTAGAADGGWILSLEDVLAGAAGLTTQSSGANSNLTFRAVEPGDAGAAVTIEFVAGNALGVSVTNQAVRVIFVSGTTTATNVLNAVQANVLARTVVNVSLAPNSDGSGVLSGNDVFEPRHLERGDFVVFDFFPTSGGVERVQSSGRVPIDEWSHVAMTFNPVTTEWRFYINGQLDNVGSGTERTLDQAGANNALLFLAQTPNVGVNSTRVEFAAAGALSVSVFGSDVTVNVVPGITTAAQVRDAINNDPLASALVRASLGSTDVTSGSNDGTGTVAATAGFEQLAFAFPASAATNAAPLRIGGEGGATASFDGYLDEVQLWARDLSNEDIAQLRTRELPPTVQVFAANQNAFDLQSDGDFFNDGNEVTIQIKSVSVSGNQLTLSVVDPRETVAPFGLQSDRYQVSIFGNRGTTDLAGNPTGPTTLLFAVDSVAPTILDFELHPTLSDTGLKFGLDQEFGRLTTTPAGANNDLRFTAVTAGAVGGLVQIEFLADVAPSVSVSANIVTVHFVAGVTRAIDVLNLVNADASAASLVSVSLPPGNNGIGLVAALAPTSLVVRAKTNQNRPFFFGQVTDPFPGSPDGMAVLLDLDGAGTFNAGTPNTRTAGGGFFTIQTIVPLSEGIHTITARVTDLAGNSTDGTISIEVDLTAPLFTRACVVDVSDGVCKVGLLADRATSLRIGASERLFDLAADASRINANLVHYTLTGQIQGNASALLTSASYSYAIPTGSSFTPLDSPGGQIQIGFGTLRPDTYTFRADATTNPTATAIMDEAGNLLDGDFPGPGPFPFQQNFPTGDGNLNDDDFVWGPPLGGFIVPDVIPPRVTALTIRPTRQIAVQFDESMDAATFNNVRVLLQRDGTPSGDNVFDVTIGTTFTFTTTVFPNDTLVIIVNPVELLPTDLYRVLLVSNPTGIADVVGNRLDGECFNGVTNCVFPSGNGVAGGDFEFRFVFAQQYFADASVPASGSGSRVSPFKTIQEAVNAAIAAPIKIDQILVTALGNGSPAVPTAAFVIPANSRLDGPAGVTLRFLPEVRGAGPGPFAAAPVVVKLDRALIDIASIDAAGLSSQISVEGTSSNRVIFTSIHDDSGVDGVLGTADDSDTNGNGTATVPAKEDWAGLLLRTPADTTQSSIRFAEFRYGGGKFNHPTFGLIAVSPIQLFDAQPVIRDNVFKNNAQAAIAADLASFRTVGARVGPQIGVNTYHDSSINGMLVLIQPAELAANDITFDDSDVVHVLTQNLNLTGVPVTLAINPGVKVKLFNSVITVGAGSAVRAIGSVNSPVFMTSLRDDSVGAGLNLAGAVQTDTNNDGAASSRAPGNFGGIEFRTGSAGTLDKVILSYGGGTVPVPSGTPRPVNIVEIQPNASVEILSSDIHDALGPGIFVTSAAPTIFNTQIRNLIADPNNPARVPAAISVSPDVLGDGPDSPSLLVHGANAFVRNNLISNSVLQDTLNPMISGMEIRAGTLSVPGRWDDVDVTHVVRGLVDIAAAAGVLTVQPGVTTKLLGVAAGLRASTDNPLSRPTLRIGAHDSDPATVEPRDVFTSLRDDNVAVRGTWLGWDGVAGDTTLFTTNFETGAAGFTGTGLWNLSTNRGLAAGHSSITSFYYGRGGGPTTPGSYATGGANSGMLTSSPLALGGIRTPITMTFNYFLQTDAIGDVAEVLARPDAASPFTVIATLTNTAANFVSQTVDISAVASPTTQLQFRFTGDGLNDFLEGFFVDDIRIFSGGDQQFSIANADNDLTQPAVGDWNSIRFNPFTNEQPVTGSTIVNADFKFGTNAVIIDGLPQTGPLVSGNPATPQGEFVIRDSMFAMNGNGVVVLPGAPLGGPQRLLPGARFENNIFVGQEGDGLLIIGAGGANPIQAVEVINNTFHRNDIGLEIFNSSGPTVLNNIFSQNATAGVEIDASSNALRASGRGPLLAFNLYATGAFLNTVDIEIAGVGVVPATVDANPVFGAPAYVSVSAAYNAATAVARDFELTRGSVAVDSARSDLPARFGTASILAPTRDQVEQFRIDAPGFANVGAGTSPFFDIGASELTDFLSPVIPTATIRLVPAPLMPLGDTGIQNDNKTNQTRPGFEGFVTDNSGDVVGLQVCLDVDGVDSAPFSSPANRFDDGCTTTVAGGFFRVAATTAIPNTANRQIDVRATDRAGNQGVASLLPGIAVDLIAPTVITLGPVAPLTNTVAVPPQTNVAVSTVDVTFSERIIIDTLDSRDLTLRLNGGPNLLGGASPVTVTFVSGTTYRIGGLGAVTAPNGTFTLTLAAGGVLDEAGNAGSGNPSISWIMDTIPPVPPVITAITSDNGTLPNDAVTNDTTLIFSGTAEPLSTVTLTRVGVGVIGTGVTSGAGNWSIGAPAGIVFPEGTFNFTATATDLATNVSNPSAAFTVVVDTTPPAAPSTPDLCSIVIAGVCPEASDTFGPTGTNTDDVTRDATPTFTGTAEPLGRVSVFAGVTLLGTAPVSAGGRWTFTSPNLADGTYNITATAIDVAGNVSAVSGTLPVRIDTSTATPSTPDLDAPSDTFGPNGTNSDNITFDTTPTFTGTSEANASVQLFSSVAGLLGSAAADASGFWIFTSGALVQGVHNVTAQATDPAGNVSLVSAALAITIDTFVAAPSAPDLDPASDNGVSQTDNITNDNTPTFNGTAEPNSTVEVFSSINGSLGTTTTSAAGNWTLTSAINIADGTHSITARAIDVAGNVSPFSAAMAPNLVVDTVPPATPPSTPDLCSVVSASCPEASDTFGPNGTNIDNITRDTTPTFAGTAEPNGTVRVFDGIVSLGIAPVSAAGVWTFTAPVLSEGVHIISATVTDVAGNETANSASLAVTIDTQIVVPSTPDLVAASDTFGPNGTNSDNVTLDNTPTFTGTAEPGSRVSLFSSVAGLLGSTSADGAGNWSFTAGSTLTDGVHVITASAIDVAGNQSAASAGLSVTIDTLANPPTQPDMTAASDTFNATPPNGSNADNVTRNTMPTFVGTAEANSFVELLSSVDGVVGSMSASGSGAWTITSSTLTAGGAPAGTTHNITARTTDLAGNVSAASTALVVRIDVTALPPSTPDLDPTSDLGSSNSDNVTRDTTPTLNGTAEPLSVVTLMDGAVALSTTPVDAVGNWTVTTLNLADGVHNFSARINDLAGNFSGSSNILQVTIDTTAPAAPSVPDLTAASDSGSSNSDNLTNITTPTFTGTAEANSTVEVNSSLAGSLGTTMANAAGQWTFTSPIALANGLHAINARATDLAGNTGPFGQSLNITIDTVAPPAPSGLDLDGASDSGLSNGDNITSDTTPTILGNASTPPQATTVMLFAGATSLGSAALNATGRWSITSPALADGVYGLTALATDAAGNTSFPSATLTITIDTTPPPEPGTPDLTAASDSGDLNSDKLTNVTTPTLTGTAEPNSRVTLFDGGATLVTADTNSVGVWTRILPALGDGLHNITAQATDLAGNVGGISPALALRIDTTNLPPVVTGIITDSGVSQSDGITNDQQITINGTAEPLSRVTVMRNGLPIGTPLANAQGVWALNDPGNTATPGVLAPGTYNYTANSLDVAGNVSASSTTFVVTIDTTPPSSIGVPALLSLDDTGVQDDNRTRFNRPRLVGTTDPGSTVDIIDQPGNCVGGTCLGDVTLADAAGRFTVQFFNAQQDGSQAVRVRARDLAGNPIDSQPIAITVDTTPPVVRTVAPSGTLLVSSSQITVTFNDDDLNSTTLGNTAFGGSVLNPQNFSLLGSGGDGSFANGNERFISLATSLFNYDAATDRLDINLRDAANNPLLLSNDSYQFRINGTTSVQDIAGNSISGGDFTRSFVVAVPPPVATMVRLFGTSKVVTQVDVTFNRSLNAALATNPLGFALLGAGGDRTFGTGDEVLVELATPSYNDATHTITLKALRGFAVGAFFQMVIDDALADTSGNRIDGDFDGVAGGDLVHLIARSGKKAISFADSDHDQVTLQVTRGGFMEVVRYANGEGRFLTLSQTRFGSALVGSVRQNVGGDGMTHFDTVSGTGGVSLREFRQPPFVVRDPIAAMVVDRMLDQGESASNLLADVLSSGLRRKR